MLNDKTYLELEDALKAAHRAFSEALKGEHSLKTKLALKQLANSLHDNRLFLMNIKESA